MELVDLNSEKRLKKRSIGAKLIAIISIIISVSLGLITFLVSMTVTADTRANAEVQNYTLNLRTSSDCENRINSAISSVVMFYDLSVKNAAASENIEKDGKLFFENNPDAAVLFFPLKNKLFVNKEFFSSHKIPEKNTESYLSAQKEKIRLSEKGTYSIENCSPAFGEPLISMFMPVTDGAEKDVAVLIYSVENLSESIATGRINESFLVNNRGIVLIHPDSQIMLKAEDFSENPFVKSMLNNNSSMGILQNYVDSNKDEYIAACKSITVASCKVITQTKTSVILAAIRSTTRRNIALTIAILSAAILAIWAFAKTLSVPLENLTAVTDEINKGNFNTDLFNKLNTNRYDEIGILNRSTKNEQNILNTVTSLTNKGVTKAIITKEIDFEPHLKDITIFFSDIRGFTAISDGFNKRFGEKSAAEIIGFLNDYMSRMVNCISITGGVVDKFEGDAVMAAWGVLRDDSLDYEKLPEDSEERKILEEKHLSHITQDAVSAIKATVAMRYALMKYNKDAEEFTKAHEGELLAKYKPEIKIGCGLNSGRATVGFMGSNEKMEFTSIGDAVNLASRTESSNKPCGTDILITQDTYDLLKKNYIKCEENNFTLRAENAENEIIVEQIPATFEVKGKGKQHFYGVVNMPGLNIEKFFRTTDPEFKADPDCVAAVGAEGPSSLKEVRTLLGIPTPDFSGVKLDESENKVKIS